VNSCVSAHHEILHKQFSQFSYWLHFMVWALTFQGVIKPLYNGLLNLVRSVADPIILNL